MQKTILCGFGFDPINLPDNFPIDISEEKYALSDKDITSLHVHDVIEFGLCIDGSGIVIVENKIFPFTEGDVCIITPKEMHLAKSTSGTTSHWYWIYVNIEKLLFPVYKNADITQTDYMCGKDFNNILSPIKYSQICSIIKKICDTYHEKKPFVKEQLISLFCLLMINLRNTFKENKNIKTNFRSSFEPDTLHRIQNAVVYMTKNYAKNILISDLANISNFSVQHFRKLFKQALGILPCQYLTQVRLAMAAADLKHSKKPISQIAIDCGFTTLSSFNRHFKRQFETSPREWRHDII